MLRLALILLAVAAPFMFPWTLAVVLIFAASIGVPFMALLGGVLMDVLYLGPETAIVPWGTILGVVGTFVAVFVHDFMKARIMGA